MLAALREAGWPVPDSQANFSWLPTADALDVAGRLEEHGLTVRPFPGRGSGSPWDPLRPTTGCWTFDIGPPGWVDPGRREAPV